MEDGNAEFALTPDQVPVVGGHLGLTVLAKPLCGLVGELFDRDHARNLLGIGQQPGSELIVRQIR